MYIVAWEIEYTLLLVVRQGQRLLAQLLLAASMTCLHVMSSPDYYKEGHVILASSLQPAALEPAASGQSSYVSACQTLAAF